MKSHIIQIQVLILFCVFFLVSCDSSEINDPIIIDEHYLNQQILLRAPSYGNTFKTNVPVLLELKYNSNNEITFPSDFNIQIFQKSSDGWIEIKEFPTTRVPSDDIVLSPEKYMPAVQVIYFYPDLLDLDTKIFPPCLCFWTNDRSGRIERGSCICGDYIKSIIYIFVL